MGWIDAELALTAIAAMLSPTTLTFSVLVLVLTKRPLRSGLWFYLGALTLTLAIGVIGAFVIGDVAASSNTSAPPKTWVAILDMVVAPLLVALVVHYLRRPHDQRRIERAVEQISKVADSPAVAVIGAGAALANPGAFIPLALKDLSELHPSTTQYIVGWLFFSLVSLLPLAVALVLLVIARDWTLRVLESVRAWLVRNARVVAAVIVLALAASMLRNGIAGLAHG